MPTTGQTQPSELPALLAKHHDRILGQWIAAQSDAGVLRPDLMKESEIRRQSRSVLGALVAAMKDGLVTDFAAPVWQDLKDMLAELTHYRVQHGFTPTETATFIMALKQPVFECLREEFRDDPVRLVDEAWTATQLLDSLGLYSNEVYQQGREEVIQRQQHEMLELSTPVVRLWDRILALPLIGTLDSGRALTVTENLLEAIVENGAEIAIIDITGVPTVDTLVAQHLLKTAAAAKLMGAECVICGIRPQIAQTIVQLGVELPDVATRADLQGAFAYALRRTGASVVRAER